MSRLIDADALKAEFTGNFHEMWHYTGIRATIDVQPTVDAVSRGVHDQVRWERDVAIKQLEEHGIPFGGIAPDVVKVVRCKDCEWYENGKSYDAYCNHPTDGMNYTAEDDFCSYGERKDNETV